MSYRTDGGAEVDLILDLGKKYLAFECKYGRIVTETQMRGLRSFEEVANKPVEKWIVYQGESSQVFSKVERAVPYRDFFLNILPAY